MNLGIQIPHISFTFSPVVLYAILGIACIGFVIASIALGYHWNNYAVDKKSIIQVQAVYFLIGILLLAIGLVSIILY